MSALSNHLMKLQKKLARQKENVAKTEAEINEIADAINKLDQQIEIPGTKGK